MGTGRLDRAIELFAKRIAAGEVMETKRDLQFYANYSTAIEAALRHVQFVDDARAKVGGQHRGSVHDPMTQRIHGVQQWGSMSEQEMINMICDIRRRFE